MKYPEPTSSAPQICSDDRQTAKSDLANTETPDRSLPKAVSVILMTVGAIACAAAGLGGLLIGFRFFTNP